MARKTIQLTTNRKELFKLPLHPNFILRHSDNFPVPIEEFTDDELSDIAEAWRVVLIKKAQKRRARL